MLIDLEDVAPATQDAAAGWSISEFRLPLGAHTGLRSGLFHGRFRPGSRHSVHLHRSCDELCVYLSGRGLVGTGEDRYATGAGDARMMPAGVPHYFHNAGTDGVAEVLGLYVGAATVAATGYEHVGEVGEADLGASERGLDGTPRHPWTRAGAGRRVEDAPGWSGAERRDLVRAEGATCFSLAVAPGGGFDGALDEPTVLFVWSGEGSADGAPLRSGQILQLERGERLQLRGTRSLELYGFRGAALSTTH